jgi:hypothetical protein
VCVAHARQRGRGVELVRHRVDPVLRVRLAGQPAALLAPVGLLDPDRALGPSASPSRLNDHISFGSPSGSRSPGSPSWRPVCQVCQVFP